VAENLIMLTLPVVRNCCRRYDCVVSMPHTFLVFVCIVGVRMVVLVWRRRHQQLIYQRKYKNLA
jgi:hypothetical protein